MNRKVLLAYEAQYFRALAYAVVYGCGLSVEQFAAAHGLDREELEQLRDHLAAKGVGV
jgi:hypothetical protein